VATPGCRRILRRDDLLVGFYSAGSADTGGIVTVVVRDRNAVNEPYGGLPDPGEVSVPGTDGRSANYESPMGVNPTIPTP
jgi:hypothetical protein